MDTPQIVPITTMQRDYNKALSKLSNGPVHLVQRSKPVAVMLDPEVYARMVKELGDAAQAKRNLQAAKNFARMDAGDYVAMTDDEIRAMRR